MEIIKDLKQKVQNNTRKIKFTHIANILMSCGFMAIGIVACITIPVQPAFSFLSNVFVRWAFPILAMAATTLSNSWALQTTKELKDENESLTLEIEKEELKQQIQQLEAQKELQKELNYLIYKIYNLTPEEIATVEES